MTIHIAHRAGALVVSAVSSAHEDVLDQLTVMLTNLVSCAERVVLDVSQLTLTQSERVARFMDRLDVLRDTSDTEIVVVASRLSARRVLRAATPVRLVAVVPTLVAALGQPPTVPGQRVSTEDSEEYDEALVVTSAAGEEDAG